MAQVRVQSAYKRAFLRFARHAHNVTFSLCIACLVLMFAAQTLVVVLRYLFAIGFVELQNLITYLFAIFCTLTVPLALRTNRHVRVDVYRERLANSTARHLDNLAILFFLMPVFGLALFHAMPIVRYSWSIFEGSRDTGGLPGYFIVLTALPITCVLMIVQGVAILIDAKLIHSEPVESTD